MSPSLIAQLNTPTNVPASPAPKKKRTKLYDAGIIIGTTVLGGGVAGVITNNQFNRQGEINTESLVKKHFPKLIEMSEFSSIDSQNNQISEYFAKVRGFIKNITETTVKTPGNIENALENMEQKIGELNIENDIKNRIETTVLKTKSAIYAMQKDMGAASKGMSEMSIESVNIIASLNEQIFKLKNQLAQTAQDAKGLVIDAKEMLLEQAAKDRTSKIISSILIGSLVVGSTVGAVIVGIKNHYNKKKESK